MKFLNVAVLVAICGLTAAHGWGHQDHHHHHGHYDHHHSHPKYVFKYGVKDTKTGDIKDQWEKRDGDHVKGAYSLKEADGTTRVVEYHADGHSGFHAHVKKIGHAHHPEAYHGYHHGHQHDHHHGLHHGYHQHHEVHHGHNAHHLGHYSHGHGHGHATSYSNFNLH